MLRTNSRLFALLIPPVLGLTLCLAASKPASGSECSAPQTHCVNGEPSPDRRGGACLRPSGSPLPHLEKGKHEACPCDGYDAPAGEQSQAEEEKTQQEKKEDSKARTEDEKQEEKYALEQDVVVTATRTKTDASNVSAFVTVVKSDDLPHKPATAADMLKAVPGLRINRYGGGLGLSSPSIRGSSTNQVLVLIDGVRLNSARGDGVDLSDIPAELIDRIEVLRGASSALYGSDAMGGVINIITKPTAKKPITKLSLTGGSFGTFGGTISRSEAMGKLDYGVWLSYNESENDFPYEFRGSEIKRLENAGYKARAVMFRTGYQASPNTRISLTHLLNHLDKRQPGEIEFPTIDAEQRNKWTLTTLSVSQKDLFVEGVEAGLNLSLRTDHLYYYDPIFVGTRASGYDGHNLGCELTASVASFRNQMLTFSLGLSDERQDSVNSGVNSRTSTSLFVQNYISVLDDKLILIPAARYDRYSDAGDSFNPKIGVCLKPVKFLSVKANASRAFRVPGFDDLFWPRTGFAEGNPDLRPEKSRGYDAGVELNIRDVLSLEVAYFLTRAKNLIQWEPGRGGVWSPMNVGEAEMKGVESRLVASPINSCRLELSHTYCDAKDVSDSDSSTQLIRRPRNKTSATLYVGKDWFSGMVQVTRTSEIYTTAANTQSLPGYTLVDCGLNLSPWKPLSLSFSVQNLFDRSYQSVPDQAMPGRSFALTLETQFEGR